MIARISVLCVLLLALRVDLTGPVLRRLTKDKRTVSGIGKTDVNDPELTVRAFKFGRCKRGRNLEIWSAQ